MREAVGAGNHKTAAAVVKVRMPCGMLEEAMIPWCGRHDTEKSEPSSSQREEE
jgi:hypothetical protein